MKTTTKTLTGVAYVTIQADIAAREGAFKPRMADLIMQCACVSGERTLEEWDDLFGKAYGAEVSIAEAIEFAEEE